MHNTVNILMLTFGESLYTWFIWRCTICNCKEWSTGEKDD